MKEPKSKPVKVSHEVAVEADNTKMAGNDVNTPAILTLGFARNPLKAVATLFLIMSLFVGVFFVANHYANKMASGFPNFQDYHIDLVDQYNTPQTVANFANQPVALFFGFTFCPDICPTTLNTLAVALDNLQTAGVNTGALRVVFLTVDPGRDTPEQLKQYLGLFDAEVTGLTGKHENVAAALKQFGIYVKKNQKSDGDHIFDHSAAVFLYQTDGRFKGTIVHNEPIDFIMEKLKSIL